MAEDLNKTKEQLSSELNDLRNKSKEREEMLEANNQQLLATEQQLRAANQQLEANNQQLVVGEQHLRAVNQQLEADNQQLTASEQQLRAANQQLIASKRILKYEKEFSENLLETANAIIITLDKDANITLFNKFAEKLTAYKKEDVLGRNWFELFIPKRNGSVIPKVFKNVLKEMLEVSSNENYILCKDGSERLINWENTVLKNENGEISGVLSIGIDITERKQAEEALKESETRFKVLHNASFGGIAIHDKGLILECNKGLSELTGYKVDELIGMDGLLLIAEESREMVMENILSAYEKPYEGIGIRKDGEKYPIRLEARQIPYKGKNVHVVEFKDITESKKKEEEISKLSTAVKQSPSVIAITDTKGDFEYVNPKFTELTGYTFEEARGQNPRILKSGEQPYEMYVELWETISSGKEWRGEFHNKKKNGELYWESASVSPIFDEHGIIINYIKVAEDISQHKRNEQIQNIIHNISNAANTSLNINEFIEFIRVELRTIIDTENFYVTLYDDKTKTISLLYHQDQKDKLESFPQGKTLTNYVIKTKKTLLATKAVKDKLVKSGEIELLGNDSKIWLGIPLMIKKKVIGAFAVQSYTKEKAFDKTDMHVLEIISTQISISIERKKAEEELKSALEKAQESDRLKSAFLMNMSHEIRTPMNGIFGFIELLKEPHLTGDEQKEYIEVIEKSGNRMLNTVNDIIDISMIEAGQVKVVKAEVSVNKILNEQYAFFNSEAQSKGLVLIYKPALSDKEATIVTDKHKLEAILTNLIKNAIKFTKKGKISFGYSLKKESNFEGVEFYVKDTGIGIPSNRIHAIFNRFEKADIEDTQVFEGSGLGLAISKFYVEILGGKISVTSEEGIGSTFVFSIPYTKQSTKESDTKGGINKIPQVSLNKLSAIVAEDDETSRLLLEVILKNKFNKITYTKTGKETIDKFRENPETNIILMDIKMPDMSGYKATREIRKFNRDVVIIAQTAYGLSGDKEKALEAGCDDYISKPINIEMLFEMIMFHLSKKSI